MDGFINTSTGINKDTGIWFLALLLIRAILDLVFQVTLADLEENSN